MGPRGRPGLKGDVGHAGPKGAKGHCFSKISHEFSSVTQPFFIHLPGLLSMNQIVLSRHVFLNVRNFFIKTFSHLNAGERGPPGAQGHTGPKGDRGQFWFSLAPRCSAP